MEVHEIHEHVEHAAHAGAQKKGDPGRGHAAPAHPPGRGPTPAHPPTHPPHRPADEEEGDAGHGHGHGHDDGHDHGGVNGKRVAILISVLAAMLALVETGAKSSQNEQLSASIEANDYWSFYQGKSVRSAVTRALADFVDATNTGTLPAEQQEKVVRVLDDWRSKIKHYDSDPHTGEGRKELQARALQAQAKRDLAQNRLHNFEYGAASLQIAVVLASASVVTNATWLTFSSMALGGVGVGLGLLGVFAPELLHHLFSRGGTAGH